MSAQWTGSRVRMRAVRPEDYPFIYSLETHPDVISRWRHQGSTPSPDQATRTMWEGQLLNLLVLSQRSGAPIGVVNAYNVDPLNGYCYMGAVGVPEVWGSALLGVDVG